MIAISMDFRLSQQVRIACVSVSDFHLQLAIRQLPANFDRPIALVDRNDSRSTVWAVDQRASKKGIFPGLRYVNAVALCPELHAVSPHPQEIDLVHQRLIRHLLLFSPEIEPIPELPGTYYLDISGMSRLEPDLNAWAQRLRDALFEKEQLKANITIGFTRFGVLFAIHTNRPITVFKSISEELDTVFLMPLTKLNLPSKPIKELNKLRIRTVGELRSLPAWEVRARFSEELYELIRKAKSTDGKVRGIRLPKNYTASIELDYVESNVEQILKIIQRIWTPLLEKMNDLLQGVREIHIRMKKDISGFCQTRLKTSEPTLNELTLVDLLRLRLDSMKLRDGVTEIAIQLIPGPLPDPQQGLYQHITKSEHDLRAANRALARVRAEFGANQILIAKCEDSHLPEESYQWKPLDSLREHAPQPQTYVSIIRRAFDYPMPIATPRRALLQHVFGPYPISGFWWRKTMIHRDDYFVENQVGSVEWIFYDHVSRQWYARGFIQ